MAIILIAIVVIILIMVALAKAPVTIKGHWQTFLDGFQISTDEFYTLVKDGLSERKITQVDIGEESFLESHILSAKRVYLRVVQDEYVVFICAAPYGTGTFVSSWLCIKDENYINRIPIISKLAGKDRENKTFYQMDTQAMFRSAVHSAVIAAVNNMTESKGIRGLTELEKQYKDIN